VDWHRKIVDYTFGRGIDVRRRGSLAALAVLGGKESGSWEETVETADIRFAKV
jgi:hypothetical protein